MTITMRRIFRETVMTVAVLLMAAVPGRQRLAAQEAGDGVLQKVGNEPSEQAGEPGSGCENESGEVPEPEVEQAGGKQGGVMELTLEGAMDLACGQSVDAAVALNQLKSAYWQYRTYKARCRHSTITTIPIRMPTVPTAMYAATGWDSPASCP